MRFPKRKKETEKELPIAVEIGKDVGRRFSEIHIGTLELPIVRKTAVPA